MNAAKERFDVVVIGAGLAGCTTARLFALKGLDVALVEHHGDMQAFKQLCTHFIQASAMPTLRRLGLDQLIEDAGECAMVLTSGPAAAGPQKCSDRQQRRACLRVPHSAPNP